MRLAPMESRTPTPDQTRARILVVEDEPEIRRFVREYLEWLGYDVTTAADAASALAQLDGTPLDLLLTDLRLPGTSGLDLMLRVREHSPGTRLILMSAHADARAAAQAIDRGVDHLVLKPFDPADLRDRIRDSLERRRAAQEKERERHSLRARLQQKQVEGNRWVRRAAHALASAVEVKDKYTAGHASRVTAYAMVLAEELGGVDLERFRLACDLHDVGKIGVPDAVLNCPRRLSDEEYALVTGHPEMGERILGPLIDDSVVLGTVRSHHERWDGLGYPDGLRGDEILLEARILAVADALDAMTSSRAYRSALPWDAAVEEILRCAGSQFDPEVVAAFETARPRLESLHCTFEVAAA
jgi:response regulator RpfG family c-di-GMP phosphodiesterase